MSTQWSIGATGNRVWRRCRVANASGMLVLLGIFLAGCSGADHEDLQQYVNTVKARPAGHIAPLPEFETYETFEYQAFDLRDPFQAEQVAVLTAGAEDNGISPDQHRRKEPLEAFPLDSLTFVGLLERETQTWGILQAPDGLVHRVQIGNYLGQNNGKILQITESSIHLKEIVPSGLGGWIERDAAISIRD